MATKMTVEEFKQLISEVYKANKEKKYTLEEFAQEYGPLMEIKKDPNFFKEVLDSISYDGSTEALEELLPWSEFLTWLIRNEFNDEAEALLKRFLELPLPEEGRGGVYCDYATLFALNLSLFNAAEKYYRRAISMDPENVVTLNDYAVALFHQEKFAKAKRYFNKALRVARNQGAEEETEILWRLKVLIPLGRALYIYRKHGKRISLIDYCVLNHFVKRAMSFARDNDYPRGPMGSKEWRHKAIAAGCILKGLSELKKIKPKPERAICWLQQAEECRVDKMKPIIHQNMAVAYLGCGLIGTALEEVEKALEKDSDNRAIQRLKRTIEDISDEKEFRPPFPKIQWGWIFGALLFWGIILLLNIFKIEAQGKTVLEFLLYKVGLGVTTGADSSLQPYLYTIMLASIIVAALLSLYPLFRFVRRLKVPGTGDIELRQFLAGISPSLLSTFTRPWLKL